MESMSTHSPNFGPTNLERILGGHVDYKRRSTIGGFRDRRPRLNTQSSPPIESVNLNRRRLQHLQQQPQHRISAHDDRWQHLPCIEEDPYESQPIETYNHDDLPPPPGGRLQANCDLVPSYQQIFDDEEYYHQHSGSHPMTRYTPPPSQHNINTNVSRNSPNIYPVDDRYRKHDYYAYRRDGNRPTHPNIPVQPPPAQHSNHNYYPFTNQQEYVETVSTVSRHPKVMERLRPDVYRRERPRSPVMRPALYPDTYWNTVVGGVQQDYRPGRRERKGYKERVDRIERMSENGMFWEREAQAARRAAKKKAKKVEALMAWAKHCDLGSNINGSGGGGGYVQFDDQITTYSPDPNLQNQMDQDPLYIDESDESSVLSIETHITRTRAEFVNSYLKGDSLQPMLSSLPAPVLNEFAKREQHNQPWHCLDRYHQEFDFQAIHGPVIQNQGPLPGRKSGGFTSTEKRSWESRIGHPKMQRAPPPPPPPPPPYLASPADGYNTQNFNEGINDDQQELLRLQSQLPQHHRSVDGLFSKNSDEHQLPQHTEQQALQAQHQLYLQNQRDQDTLPSFNCATEEVIQQRPVSHSPPTVNKYLRQNRRNGASSVPPTKGIGALNNYVQSNSFEMDAANNIRRTISPSPQSSRTRNPLLELALVPPNSAAGVIHEPISQSDLSKKTSMERLQQQLKKKNLLKPSQQSNSFTEGATAATNESTVDESLLEHGNDGYIRIKHRDKVLTKLIQMNPKMSDLKGGKELLLSAYEKHLNNGVIPPASATGGTIGGIRGSLLENHKELNRSGSNSLNNPVVDKDEAAMKDTKNTDSNERLSIGGNDTERGTDKEVHPNFQKTMNKVVRVLEISSKANDVQTIEKKASSVMSSESVRKQLKVVQAYQDPDVFLIQDLLSKEECKMLIEHLSKNQWKPSTTCEVLLFKEDDLSIAGGDTIQSVLHEWGRTWETRLKSAFNISGYECLGLLLLKQMDSSNFKPIKGTNYVCSIYLNADYSGGKEEFQELGFKLKPELGLCVGWPHEITSNVPVMTRSLPVTKGVKYQLRYYFRRL